MSKKLMWNLPKWVDCCVYFYHFPKISIRAVVAQIRSLGCAICPAHWSQIERGRKQDNYLCICICLFVHVYLYLRNCICVFAFVCLYCAICPELKLGEAGNSQKPETARLGDKSVSLWLNKSWLLYINKSWLPYTVHPSSWNICATENLKETSNIIARQGKR